MPAPFDFLPFFVSAPSLKSHDALYKSILSFLPSRKGGYPIGYIGRIHSLLILFFLYSIKRHYKYINAF